MLDETKKEVFEQLKTLFESEISSDYLVEVVNGHLMVYPKKTPDAKHSFATVMIHKHHVGFYYSPVTIDSGSRAAVPDALAKMLKGKSCFHIKRPLDADKAEQLRGMIQAGMVLWQKKGLV